jgi:predicted acylesterase/phospholipase RssA
LGEAEQVTHFDGVLWTALRASCAIPGIGPPLLIGGRVLVDGGVLNNLPIDVMRERFAGNLIAVDVTAYSPIRFSAAYELQCPSGFEILWNKINPFTKTEPIPSIMEILFRTATLSSQLRARQLRDTAELLITPAVQRYEVTEFDRFHELVETGYRHTVEVLEQARNNPGLKAKLWPAAGAVDATHETL